MAREAFLRRDKFGESAFLPMAVAFSGNSRFEVHSRLGRGGMGSVYRVFDRDRGRDLALKAVGSVEGEELLRFKREFRALRDLRHRNLIVLDELFEEHREWFYTMELLEGLDFLSYVRRRATAAAIDAHDTASDAPAAGPKLGAAGPTIDPPSPPSHDRGFDSSDASGRSSGARRDPPLAASSVDFDEARLRNSLAQLGDALAALHAAGMVHRDIKPSNLMMTPEDRLVLFDFGLVTNLEDGRQHTDVGFMGTYHYMSPEQVASKPVDGRADWYAVGVMLFQAMTGRLPFAGEPTAVLLAKTREDAPDPSMLVAGLPADLVSLCRELLAANPDDRPNEHQILARLNGGSADSYVSTVTRSAKVPFIGRKSELEALLATARRVDDGEPAMVVVRGGSGVGKSALVRAFLDSVEDERRNVWLLEGRCGEREEVPYRSVDGVIDHLSSYLARLTDRDVSALLPRDAEILTKAFPVLRRVRAFDLPIPERELAPQEQRSRLFVGLRHVLRRLGRMFPIVVVLEDLQWLDNDSRALLGELLRPPEAPKMLVVGSLRTEPSGDLAPGLADFLALATDAIDLAPLPEDDCLELASAMLAVRDAGHRIDVSRVASESRGHPLYLDELTRHLVAHSADQARSVTLEEVVAARIRSATSEARDVLELVCGEGLIADRNVVERASTLSPAEFDAQCNALSSLRLVRLRGDQRRPTLEPYHHGVRDAWWATMAEPARAIVHGRLARAHEASESPDPFALSVHWAGAGAPETATRYAELAGDRAVEVLAFDRAAQLYTQALAFGAEAGTEQVQRRIVKLARALASAGRGEEAGETFLRAAAGEKSPVEALEIRRRAAEQFMLTGATARGREIFREVLGALGERFHEGTGRALAAFLWNQAVIRWRTPRVVLREAGAVDPHERLRYMALQSAGVTLAPIESIRGGELMGRAHKLATRIGEPGRLAWSMVYASANAAAANPTQPQSTYLVLDRAMRLAEQSGDPAIIGVVRYGYALTDHLMGRWMSSVEHLGEADRIFREECVEAPPEMRMVQALFSPNLWEAGRLRRIRVHNSRALQEARERGDLFMEANLQATSEHYIGCMDDDPEPAMAAAEAAMARWEKGYNNQYFSFVEGRAMASVYLGNPLAGWERLCSDWTPMRRNLVFGIQVMMYRALRLRAQLALAVANAQPDRARPLIARAKKDARALERMGSEYAAGTGHMLRAAAMRLEGAPLDDVRSWLEVARGELERSGMRLHYACCTRLQGVLIDGREGAELVAKADAYFREHGVLRPARFAEMLLAGAGGEEARS